MKVEQTGRSENSITVTVSGMTEGDRQTYIWITDVVLGENDGALFTLAQAKSKGYIDGYDVTDFDDNNGDITVYFPDSYIQKCLLCTLIIRNIVGDSYTDMKIETVLAFVYENTIDKKPGEVIDVTVGDMRKINLFAAYIVKWIGENAEASYYPLEDIEAGDEIKFKYLLLPAENILYACKVAFDKMTSLGAAAVLASSGYIVNYCKENHCESGVPFEAYMFTAIRNAINHFALSIEA